MSLFIVSSLDNVNKIVQEHSRALDSSIIITSKQPQQLASQLLLLQDASIQHIYFLYQSDLSLTFYEEIIPHLFKLLKDQGKLSIDVTSVQPLINELIIECKIHGFTDILTNGILLTMTKSDWNVNKVSVPLSKKPNNTSSWKVAINNLVEEDLIDETDLLMDDEYKVDVKISESDCGPGADGKKRACKNCTCGLAEELQGNENGDKSVANENSQSKSACGNCYKGDAFRCGSCPFLGKPAFEQGQEKVVLSMEIDDI